MPKVTIADCAGFCFGVERAIKLVYDARKNHDNVVTFGPIIHNPQAVSDLESMGVFVKNSIGDITSAMTAVIRTHGASKDDAAQLNARAHSVLDATCPFVKKVQSAAQELSKAGYSVVVVGEADHPEVHGIISYIDGEYFNVVSVEEAEKLPERDKYGVVAQTTQNGKAYDEIVSVVKTKAISADVSVAYTICNATHNRQAAALELAKHVDVMIIVGGRNSANTTRLYQLCKAVCERTYHIETKAEVSSVMMADAAHVGISAGASTPNFIVSQVKDYILENGK
ncbi:MAG: 4-hydroxy-3-methylbut-2-enyl diphosphate reductase [Deferribacteraceae bacterium]|jgi:4-hydroxy-3-methylbut-2-enyl diphosphate reductase|nr:4-hydroxy-3-methylbut-2-enyl diphosphate reductase [Deferribacteraceae bacterium]